MNRIIQVKLITDGGFEGLEKLNYDTVFDATVYSTMGVDIKIGALIAAGGSVNFVELNVPAAEGGEAYFSNGINSFLGKEYEEVK